MSDALGERARLVGQVARQTLERSRLGRRFGVLAAHVEDVLLGHPHDEVGLEIVGPKLAASVRYRLDPHLDALRALAEGRGRTITTDSKRLQQVLKSLPKDAEPPFLLLSQSAFKLRTAEREGKK